MNTAVWKELVFFVPLVLSTLLLTYMLTHLLIWLLDFIQKRMKHKIPLLDLRQAYWLIFFPTAMFVVLYYVRLIVFIPPDLSSLILCGSLTLLILSTAIVWQSARSTPGSFFCMAAKVTSIIMATASFPYIAIFLGLYISGALRNFS